MTLLHSSMNIRIYSCNVCQAELQLSDPNRSLASYGWTNTGWEHFCPEHHNFVKQKDTTNIDLVSHPPHYTSHPSGVEAITICEHMDFCLGNAMKYLWRAGHKDSTTEIEDLKKSRWYLDRAISNLEKT